MTSAGKNVRSLHHGGGRGAEKFRPSHRRGARKKRGINKHANYKATLKNQTAEQKAVKASAK